MQRPQTAKSDRDKAKPYVLLLGVREAARQLGLNEDTVSAWSARYHWLKDHREAIANSKKNYLQAAASSSPNTLSVYSKNTKLSLAVATNKAAKKLSKLPATKLVRPDMSVSVKNYTSTASVLHDWQAEQPGSGVVSPLTVYSKQTVIGVSHSLGQQPDKSLGKEQDQSLGKDQNQGQNQDQT
jgi:hypothetical protein